MRDTSTPKSQPNKLLVENLERRGRAVPTREGFLVSHKLERGVAGIQGELCVHGGGRVGGSGTPISQD